MNIDKIVSSVARGKAKRRTLALREASAKYVGTSNKPVKQLCKNINRTI